MSRIGKFVATFTAFAALTVMSAGPAQATVGEAGAGTTATTVYKQVGASGTVHAAATTMLSPKQMTELQAASPQFVQCFNPFLDPDYYHVICNSDQFWTPWVFCSDGFWYAVNSFLGFWEVFTFCPLGLTALAGVVTVP